MTRSRNTLGGSPSAGRSRSPARLRVQASVAACAALVLWFGTSGANPATSVTRLMILVEKLGFVAVETVPVADGEEVVLSRPELVTVLLPYGLGQSGDVVQKSRRAGETRVRRAGGVLEVRVRQPDGSFRDLPPVSLTDLAEYDMRVNVTGAGGKKKAFRISGYEEVAEDGGPVIDMFRGMVPLADGDYAVTTEVTRRREPARIAGRTGLLYQDGLIFTTVANRDGRSGLFVVDLGAGGTVISRDFLPAGVEIEKIEGVEYSEKGARKVAGTMGGAGGEVSSLLGAAALGSLTLGKIVIDGVRANVVQEMPQLGGRPVAGILGVDVLARTSRLRLERTGKEAGTLTFDSAAGGASHDRSTEVVEVPFTWVAKHLLIDAAFGDVPASLILDTGARGSLIPATFAKRAGLPPAPGAPREFRGLDGRALASDPVLVENLGLAGTPVGAVVFHATDLTVVESMGLEENTGLLGNDFLFRYRVLEVDFQARAVRLVGRA